MRYNANNFRMLAAGTQKITELLNGLGADGSLAKPEAFALIYAELRRIAARQLRQERPGHTLQPTALVHEAYARLAGCSQDWENRSHFFAVAAMVMRQVLVDHAKKRRALKRGGGGLRVEFHENLLSADLRFDSLIDLDRLLLRLSEFDARAGEIVTMRVFGDLSVIEIAEVLGVSDRTVKRDLNVARAWIRRELCKQPRE